MARGQYISAEVAGPPFPVKPPIPLPAIVKISPETQGFQVGLAVGETLKLGVMVKVSVVLGVSLTVGLAEKLGVIEKVGVAVGVGLMVALPVKVNVAVSVGEMVKVGVCDWMICVCVALKVWTTAVC
jgi:hypothetical protein